MAIMTKGIPFLRKSFDVGIPEACTIKLGGVPKEVMNAKAVLIAVIIAINAKLKSAADPTANVIGTSIAAAAPSLITLVSKTVTTIIIRIIDKSPPNSEP